MWVMMSQLWAWSMIALTLSAVPYIASDEAESCTPVPGSSSCSCVFPNGTGFDLKPASTAMASVKSFKSTDDLKYEMNEYFFHPCSDEVMPQPENNTIQNSCHGPVAICRHVKEVNLNKSANTFTYTERYEDLGYNQRAAFDPTGRSIAYGNKPSTNIVLLQCAPLSVKDELVVDEGQPNGLVLTYISRNACLKDIVAVSHRSTGSTLLIIFFTLLLFYVVLGVCTKKFLMGAQGLEIIPNLSFWVDLPSLVKDGWFFLIGGCRTPARGPAGATTSPDPNSYDSI